MQVIVPNALSVISGNVPEDDAPLYSETTTYASFDEVIYTQTVPGSPHYGLHGVYRCLIAGTVGIPPEDVNTDGEGLPWRFISPTNLWACVDLYRYTKTQAPTGQNHLEITVPYDRPATAVYLLGMEASTYQIQVVSAVDPTNIVYDSGELRLLEDSANWWEYWFSPYRAREDGGHTDTPLVTGNLKIILDGSEPPALGRIIVGQRVVLGQTEYGATGGLVDYSRVTEDDFGRPAFQKGYNSKRANFSALMRPREVNYVQSTISRIEGMPVLWIADNNAGYDPLIVFGYIKEYDVSYTNVSTARVTLDIRGVI